MRAQRSWKPVKNDGELERLRVELASFNIRILELEKQQPDCSKIEGLKASAVVLSRQMDELRCSTDDLGGLLAK
jgi:hypothetical protein